MIGEMKIAALLGKAKCGDASAVSALETLRMATANGAKAFGLGDKFGTLEAGKYADMINVDMDGVEQTPLYNVMSHIVYCTTRDAVKDVWVGGKRLMRDRYGGGWGGAELWRELTTIDVASLKARVAAWVPKVIEATTTTP
jgi:5-methylthioadenosine/S-adenosylhomocysteine deaminase